MIKGSAKWLNDAVINDPAGKTCAFCGKPNDLADDCGWFYIAPNREETGRPVCFFCWESGLGLKHQAIYGVGDR